MNKNLGQDKSKITPASHGDELDVLEALHWLEKSSDKQILSSNQRNKLASSGRIEEKKDNIKMTKEEAIKRSHYIIQSILTSLDKYKHIIYSDDSWNNFDGESKLFARKELFNKIYGIKPKDVGYSMFINMMGGSQND